MYTMLPPAKQLNKNSQSADWEMIKQNDLISLSLIRPDKLCAHTSGFPWQNEDWAVLWTAKREFPKLKQW